MISNTTLILIGRFLYGITAGLNSALVPLYIREISPVEYSGETGSVAMIFLHLGILVSYLFGFGNPTLDSTS